MRTIASLLFVFAAGSAVAADRPNVLIVITDDQGYGDLGAHGNPVVRTPHLDAFAKESVRLKNFYVAPVCSPTRAGLMTGRYPYRTGVVDTYLGRALMRPDEVTLAERLAAAGYRTGLFGKWHLGDNHPLRPEDQGFQHTLWCRGGGLAQPSDAPGTDPKTAYFDPVLTKNGTEVKTTGYCTDVFTAAALDFVAADADTPFFAYVAYNAPHGPFQVPEPLVEKYRQRDLTADGFPKIGRPWATPKLNTEEIARAYAMIENIDTNFGRLAKAVPANTLVIFLTDNGPGGVRFNGGLRDRKGTVYEGGIRVPCYVRWSAAKGGREIDLPLANIDVTPTLIEACGLPADDTAPPCDGRSFLRLFTGGPGNWPGRTLFNQWHRGDVPEKGRAFAARGPRFKLVQAAGVAERGKWVPKYELFDLDADPFEAKDLAAEKPAEVEKLRREYEAWFDDVTRKGFDPPRISVGSAKENPVRLSRQDWRGDKAGWAPDSNGEWAVKVERTGVYRATLISHAEFTDYELFLGGSSQGAKGGKGMAKSVTFDMYVTAGETTAAATVSVGGKPRGVDYLILEYVGK